MDEMQGLPPGFELEAQPQQTPNIEQPTAHGMSSGSDQLPEGFVSNEELYGSPKQQAITALEGVAEGVLGPLATGFEKHILKVPEQDILGRRETNPVTHGVSQAVGLGAGLFTGVGEAALMGKAGQLATEAVGLANLGKEAGLLSKIGAEAIDQATQMAIFQGGDEISKMIINDPQATVENAVTNVGMNALLGGATGAAFGAVSPLFKAAISDPASKMLGEMKDRIVTRQAIGDLGEAATKEVDNLIKSADDVRMKLYSGEGGGLKGEMIAKTLPEVTEANTVKIQNQLQEVSDKLSNTIIDMSENSKLSHGAKYLEQDLKDFQAKVMQGDVYKNGFDALNDLKNQLQSYAKYNTNAAESEFGKVAKQLAAELRPALEDAKVWGEAANIQKAVNERVKEFIPFSEQMQSKFTSKLGDQKVIDPDKIKSFLNQADKGKGEIKQELVKEYLDKHEALISDINKMFTEKGMEAPLQHTPTNVLREALGEKTAGAKLADYLIDKVGSEVAGKAVAGGVGTYLGGLAGQPILGALAGEYLGAKHATKAMESLMKFVVEKPVSAEGFKSAMDMTIAAIKGQTALNKAVGGVFNVSEKAIAGKVIPSVMDREKLDKVVTQVQQNPNKLTEINNGNIAHYMDGHQTAISETQTRAIQYLQSIKPQPYRSSPLDKEIQPSDAEMARYNRALDIAQQPLSVLQHVKDGTLQQSDIKDLATMYPSLYKQMVGKMTDEISGLQAAGKDIPYHTRIGLGLFMGQALDTTMKPESIMAAQPMPKQPPQAPNQPTPKAPRGTAHMGKNIPEYMTPLQASQAHKASK